MPLFPTPMRDEPKGLIGRLRRSIRRRYDRLWWRLFIRSILLSLGSEKEKDMRHH
jgi:hypothetical protein